MAIKIGANFSYNGPNFLDTRQSFATLEEMKNCLLVPDGFITYCQEDEKRYEFKSSNTINELTGKWREFKVNQEIDSSLLEDCYYLGTEEPADDKIWFYNSTANSSSEVTYDNPLIAELFAVIQSMQAQITQLQADVEYLKLNGGGGFPIEPPDGPGDEPDEPEEIEVYLTLEDGGLFELEDGGFVILEETIHVTKDPVLILEDGFSFLLEDGSFILLEETVSVVKDNLMLLESGAEMLLENGKNILLEY
jgi:hypothetical protein